MKKKKHKRISDIIAIIIMIVAIGVFAYAAYHLYLIFSEYHAGEQEYEELREFVQLKVDENEADSEPDEDIVEAEENFDYPCPITVDFQALYEVNPDIVGWIYIEAIPSISYPIVQGKDNDFYLKHTVEKVRNSSASIFLDYRNADDFTDSNTIIYGHNMKNLSMFGLLKRMKEPEQYAKSPYIWVLTPDGEYCYEVFSARNVSERDDVYKVIRSEPEEFKAKLESYQAASEISGNQTFDGTECIITLSTCTSNDTQRCIVQAVRKVF